MIFTTDDLNNLKAALVTGAQTVTVGGRSVTYRSKAELLELISMVQDAIDGVSDGSELSSIIVSGFDRQGR